MCHVDSMESKQAAVRIVPEGEPEAPPQVPAITTLSMRVFSPEVRTPTQFDRWLERGFWRRTDQHGRLFYERMASHPAVEAALGSFISFLVALDGAYTTQTADPSAKQKEIADFANAQIVRMGTRGMPWAAFKAGFFGGGYLYGFTLAERPLALAFWRGKKMVQVDEVKILPQASLDQGDRPDMFFGDLSTQSPKYDCFNLDAQGRIIGVQQYRNFSQALKTAGAGAPLWEGQQLLNILHFKNGGEDGNPFGKSILHPAAEAWADLYMRERMEQQFLDVSTTPWLHVNRVNKDGTPSPAFIAEVKDLVQERDAYNLMVTTNAEVESVTAANRDYTEHVTINKKELRQYLAQAVGIPADIWEVTDTNEQNARDKIVFFMKFRASDKVKRMEDFMTYQFIRPVIDANWSNLDPEDYPVYRTHLNRDDEARTVAAMLPTVIKYFDAGKLGEIIQTLIPGARREWVPTDHSDSVDVKRPLRDTNDEHPVGSQASPPDRSGARGDGGGGGSGETKSVGQRVRSGV